MRLPAGCFFIEKTVIIYSLREFPSELPYHCQSNSTDMSAKAISGSSSSSRESLAGRAEMLFYTAQ
jgi:hypothetical protein